eukprot:TRINITY_DN10794_c0_g1_i1.p2 TRINITY_DN10794_c0_g1~~TRINITY_DN10794_c0_g1_i1.p2  ORF type:complete len:270 (-),score=65.42 TRINITY_DN10794_c0_g1_i1:1118-1927(-)
MAAPKKIEKFGVQVDKPRKIFCFPNGDVHHKGVSILLQPKKFHTYDQLKTEMTKIVGLVTGAVFKVVTPDGKQIKTMDDFEDGKPYICCGAEPLKKDQISKVCKQMMAELAAQEKMGSCSISEEPKQTESAAEASAPSSSSATSSASSPPTSPPSATRHTSAAPDSSGKKTEKFGVQAEKAKVILCFRNGDKHHAGERMTVSSKKYKTYDQLLTDMTKTVKPVTGAIRKVCTADGKTIKSMDDIEDGKSYVCCGAEPFDHEKKPLALKS